MKLIVELPDNTKCAVVSYVCGDNYCNLNLGARTISTEDIKNGYSKMEEKND